MWLPKHQPPDDPLSVVAPVLRDGLDSGQRLLPQHGRTPPPADSPTTLVREQVLASNLARSRQSSGTAAFIIQRRQFKLS